MAIAKSDGIVTKDEKEFIEEIKILLNLDDLSLDDLKNIIEVSEAEWFVIWFLFNAINSFDCFLIEYIATEAVNCIRRVANDSSLT